MFFFSIASKQVNIRWIRTDSQLYINTDNFLKNIEIQIIKLLVDLLVWALGPIGANKTDIPGKLFFLKELRQFRAQFHHSVRSICMLPSLLFILMAVMDVYRFIIRQILWVWGYFLCTCLFLYIILVFLRTCNSK